MKNKTKYLNKNEAFVFSFSNMDIPGLTNLLNDQYIYENQTKEEMLDDISIEFEMLKAKGIVYLKPIATKCKCHIDDEGYTFLDEKEGYFFNIILEEIDTKTLGFKQCVHLDRIINLESRKKLIYLPYGVLDDIPF
ncbi:MAG: hypothetical protein ABIQ27_00200 [Flavobacterium sp.]|uniref:hypothetical protein n=1 Tax=Flavobacterium sp. TaxID=239 RepID=UPI003262F1D3